jgi:hypothetical protein
VKIPATLKAAAEDQAHEEDKTLSELIRTAVIEYLDHHAA